MKTLGKNIKKLRQEAKISQKEFAILLNTSQQRVSEWECDKIEPSFLNIIRILNALNISFEELIEDIAFD